MELWHKIFDDLPIEDILVLARTSRRMHELKDLYCRFVYSNVQFALDKHDCRSVFSLQRKVFPFLDTEDDVRTFVNTMKETLAVISGSTALQFFDRTVYQHADLDLYFEARYLGLWRSHLNAFGYSKLPQVDKKASITTENNTGYPCFEEIESLETFKHQMTNKVIQLMATKASPIRAILDFHSSKCCH